MKQKTDRGRDREWSRDYLRWTVWSGCLFSLSFLWFPSLSFPLASLSLLSSMHLTVSLSLCLCVQWVLIESGLMRMMCCSDKTRLRPPVKHSASLALIIDRAGAPLEGFTRGENITLTTSIVYHHWTLDCAPTKWSAWTKHLEFLINLHVKWWKHWHKLSEDHELYVSTLACTLSLWHQE